MIIAMLLIAAYNLADAIWVAGLGADALAGVGFVTPLFMILVGLSNGLGAGATSAVARRIGARDKQGADNAALHSALISLVVSAVLMILILVFLRPILLLFGAGAVIGYAMEYGTIIFLGTIFFLLVQMAYAILRAEGDTKRTMYAIAISAVLNFILDPLFIYGLGLGVAGAALATIISIAAVTLPLSYWFFFKQDTYVTLSPREFSFDPRTFRDILRVGLPASIEFLVMSLVSILINVLLVRIAGTDAVAVYTSGWRIVMFAIVPLAGIATSIVSVAGAAYGSREYGKIREAFRYSITIGVTIAAGTGFLTWLFAPQITALFTYSAESAHLAPSFILFFQTMCFFYPFAVLGMFSGSVFQGTGRGLTSLTITILRNIVFIIMFTYLFAFVLDLGEFGVYLGIVAGDILGGLAGYLWAAAFIRRLVRIENHEGSVRDARG
jgi:putative MATE family efflux protein